MNKFLLKLLNLGKHKEQITEVELAEAYRIVSNRRPKGLFITQKGEWWLGIDNRTGDAWPEHHRSRKACERWLRECQK